MLPYLKRPLKRGQCRLCPEIHPKFKDYLLHEATHRVKKGDPQPEVTREPGKQVNNKEPKKLNVENYDWNKDFRLICTKGERIAYQCKICSIKLMGLSKHHLLHHAFVHSGERLYQCGKCPKIFRSLASRKRHEITHAGPFKCLECSQDFTRPSNLSHHMKSHFSKMLDKKKAVQTNKLQDVKVVIEKKVILCLNRVDHVKEHANLYSQASKRLSSSLPGGSQDKTIKTGMIFEPKLSIQRRVQKFTNYGNSQVDPDAEIKERIWSYDWTKDFRKIYSEDGKITYKCKICSFKRLSLWKLELLHHTFIHTGELPYQCSHCPKKFKQLNNKKAHENIHTGKRSYK